jgi:hypothetical protein
MRTKGLVHGFGSGTVCFLDKEEKISRLNVQAAILHSGYRDRMITCSLPGSVIGQS